ncbi:MAG: hypothetical protein JW873_03640 [Candidatus Saganbacteria bacterium]|nr:hypothetical protein [Candidatus Saganbacteria bacterium]
MPNLTAFESKMTDSLHPSLTAREMAEHFVVAVLEAEYGQAFTRSPGFDKMVGTLAEMIVTNPELRRQTLAVASALIKKNRDNQKNRI